MQFIQLRILATVMINLILCLSIAAADWPAVIKKIQPGYPSIAKAKKISGTVLIDVEINGKGQVITANPIMGHELLRKAAKGAAIGWRFKPLGDGRTHTVRLTFIFHEDKYTAPEKEPDFTSPYQVEIL